MPNSYCLADDLETQIQREQQKLEYIQKKISQHKNQAASYGKQEQNLLTKLEEVNQREELAKQKIKVLELKEKKLNAKIAELTQKIKREETVLAKAKDALRSRVVSLYKYGSLSQYKLLFAAENVQEALSMSYLLGRVARADSELILEVKEKKASLESSKRQLQAKDRSLCPTKRPWRPSGANLFERKTSKNASLQR